MQIIWLLIFLLSGVFAGGRDLSATLDEIPDNPRVIPQSWIGNQVAVEEENTVEEIDIDARSLYLLPSHIANGAFYDFYLCYKEVPDVFRNIQLSLSYGEVAHSHVFCNTAVKKNDAPIAKQYARSSSGYAGKVNFVEIPDRGNKMCGRIFGVLEASEHEQNVVISSFDGQENKQIAELPFTPKLPKLEFQSPVLATNHYLQSGTLTFSSHVNRNDISKNNVDLKLEVFAEPKNGREDVKFTVIFLFYGLEEGFPHNIAISSICNTGGQEVKLLDDLAISINIPPRRGFKIAKAAYTTKENLFEAAKVLSCEIRYFVITKDIPRVSYKKLTLTAVEQEEEKAEEDVAEVPVAVYEDAQPAKASAKEEEMPSALNIISKEVASYKILSVYVNYAERKEMLKEIRSFRHSVPTKSLREPWFGFDNLLSSTKPLFGYKDAHWEKIQRRYKDIRSFDERLTWDYALRDPVAASSSAVDRILLPLHLFPLEFRLATRFGRSKSELELWAILRTLKKEESSEDEVEDETFRPIQLKRMGRRFPFLYFEVPLDMKDDFFKLHHFQLVRSYDDFGHPLHDSNFEIVIKDWVP